MNWAEKKKDLKKVRNRFAEETDGMEEGLRE